MNTGNHYTDEILVVDDAPASLKLLEDILSTAGYRVQLANDGELALRAAKIRPPALILLDIRMPGMDGFEVSRRLKTEERTSNIPVIFISVTEDESEKPKVFQMGAANYINKPFCAEEVLARVKNHLALKRVQRELKRCKSELKTARDTLFDSENRFQGFLRCLPI